MWPQLLRCGNTINLTYHTEIVLRFNVAATFALRKLFPPQYIDEGDTGFNVAATFALRKSP